MTETSWPSPTALLCAALLAVFAFGLFSWKNDFSYYYHTDEPSKVHQITTGWRKFNHPLLLISATELLARVRGDLSAPQAVAIDGRLVSAAASALSVGLLTLLGAYLFGLGGGILAGFLLATHPLLFELSHYLKEDCCLLLGVSAFFAALAVYERRRNFTAAILLGAACGLATSGKYIGVITLIVAVPTLLVYAQPPSSAQKWKQAGWLFMGFGAVFLILNFQALKDPTHILQGLQREEATMDKHEKRQEERADEKVSWPKAFQSRVLRNIPKIASLPLLTFAVAGIILMLRRRETPARILYPMLAFLFIYLVVIPFSPLTKTRYLLPMVPVLCLCAAEGLMAIRLYGFRGGRMLGAVVATLGILLLLMPNIAATYRLGREFTFDSHRELMNWIARYLPPGGIYAVEQRSHLQDLWHDEKADTKVPVVFRNDDIVDKPEVLTAMQAGGVTYVILTEDAYTDAAELARDNDAQRKVFEQMFAPPNLLWHSPEGDLRYLHPGLRLYRLTPVQPKGHVNFPCSEKTLKDSRSSFPRGKGRVAESGLRHTTRNRTWG